MKSLQERPLQQCHKELLRVDALCLAMDPSACRYVIPSTSITISVQFPLFVADLLTRIDDANDPLTREELRMAMDKIGSDMKDLAAAATGKRPADPKNRPIGDVRWMKVKKHFTKYRDMFVHVETRQRTPLATMQGARILYEND